MPRLHGAVGRAELCAYENWVSVICILTWTVQLLIFSGNSCVILDFRHQRWPILCLLPCPSHVPLSYEALLSPRLLVVALWTPVMERFGVCHSPVLNGRTGFSYLFFPLYCHTPQIFNTKVQTYWLFHLMALTKLACSVGMTFYSVFLLYKLLYKCQNTGMQLLGFWVFFQGENLTFLRRKI